VSELQQYILPNDSAIQNIVSYKALRYTLQMHSYILNI